MPSAEERAAAILTENGLKWSIDGKELEITPPLVKATIDKVVALLKSTDNATQIEVGGLLVKQSNNHIDVYVHLGDYNDSDKTG